MGVQKLHVGKDKTKKKEVTQTLKEQIDKAKTIADVKEILKKIASQ
jgi:predicted DNA-binding protein YlxM (UPF0122 family)